jgi:hypothetical protein
LEEEEEEQEEEREEEQEEEREEEKEERKEEGKELAGLENGRCQMDTDANYGWRGRRR